MKIPLVDTMAEVVNRKGRSFKILTSTDMYYVQAHREKEMDHWVASINHTAKVATHLARTRDL